MNKFFIKFPQLRIKVWLVIASVIFHIKIDLKKKKDKKSQLKSPLPNVQALLQIKLSCL